MKNENEIDLESSLETVWTSLAQADDDALYSKFASALLKRYDEPQRAYHTRRHLEECIAEFKDVAHLAERPHELTLAIFYHDAIYDPTRKDNEEQSAALFRQHAKEISLNDDAADRIGSLIVGTASHESCVGDAALLNDIDLSILAAPAKRFAEYELQIRREYGHVPEADYLRGRGKVLRKFLARDRIFSTSSFEDREFRARSNIAASVAQSSGESEGKA